MHGAFSMPKSKAMFEFQNVLRKIEKLVDQLPYRSVKIEIELKDQTLILEKEKTNPVGFIKE